MRTLLEANSIIHARETAQTGQPSHSKLRRFIGLEGVQVNRKLLAFTVFACMLGGCATGNNQAGAEPDPGVMVTGSRIPQKTTGSNAVSGMSQEGWEETTRGHKQINPQGR